MPINWTSKSIQDNKLFTGVNKASLNSFFDQKEIKEAKEGEILYKTGDESNAVYMIIKGEIRVKFPANNYLSNKIFNDFFGEKEIVDRTRRISSAVAFSRTVYYKIDRVAFNSLIAKNSTIGNNLKKYGELQIPEVSVDSERKFDITERTKPISFKAFTRAGKEDDESKKEPPPVMTQQIIPDLDSMEDSLDESIENELKSFDEETINFDEVEIEESEEVSAKENNSEEVSISENNSANTITPESEDHSGHKIKIDFNSPVENKSNLIIESGINREVVRKIFTSIDRIYSSINIQELVKNSTRAFKDLVNAESSNLILVDEKVSSMLRIRFDGDKAIPENFQLSDGLTGSCALQKKIINYDRPSEDSRFSAHVDQTGPARLKRILYFPIISDAGETVAVIQTARENKKFTEDEISSITMLSKQVETAIERTKIIEQIVQREKYTAGKKLQEIVTKEIQVPLEIIKDYTEILSQKNLPEEVDDIIRMLQKQSNSVEDITKTLFQTTLINDIKLESSDFQFNGLIDDILELLSEYCEARDVKLYKKIGDGAIVNIDRSKFYTAIFQIIKSSCDDSRTEGRIYFSTEFTDGMILITVQNEGKGILTEPEGNIFDFLYSGKELKEEDLGLLLARKIILAHSGQIHLQSIKGNGSTFQITLPVIQAETTEE